MKILRQYVLNLLLMKSHFILNFFLVVLKIIYYYKKLRSMCFREWWRRTCIRCYQCWPICRSDSVRSSAGHGAGPRRFPHSKPRRTQSHSNSNAVRTYRGYVEIFSSGENSNPKSSDDARPVPSKSTRCTLISP